MIQAAVQVAWRSIAGARHRQEGRENEDAVIVDTGHPVLDAVLLMADGMGGHPLPRQAAAAAAEGAQQFLGPIGQAPGPEDAPGLLRDTVAAANERVRALRPADRNGRPPGTTFAVAVIAGGWLHLANVGDGSAFLSRGDSVRRLAGGEDRRIGSRPLSFLGSPEPPELEEISLPLEPGDRLILCTDGLTRYFTGPAGERQLAEILARREADAAAVAGQLTAHSRSEEYDDDTSVVVADVTGLQTVSDRRPARHAPAAPPGGVHPAVWVIVGAALGAILVAAGYTAGRRSVPPAAAPLPSPGQPAATGGGATGAVDLSHLPKGNVVLVDETGRQVLLLRTRAEGPAGPGSRTFRGLQLRPDRRLDYLPGSFTLDPGGRTLRDPDGRAYPVSTDPNTGIVSLVPAGVLVVQTVPPGLHCAIDGREAGLTPRRESVAAGFHTVRVWDARGSTTTEVAVPAGRTLALILGPQ